MRDLFSQTFPLDPTLKQIDADIARFPGRADLWQTRATILGSHGKTVEALESLARALALVSDPPPQKEERTRKRPTIVVQNGPDHAGILYDIAEMYLKRYKEAIAEYEVARHWKPDLPSVLRNIGDACCM